jgi:hypothetical protein
MIQWLRDLFGLSRWDKPCSDPRRHDCRWNGWGHSTNCRDGFIIKKGKDAGRYWHCSGHLYPRVRVGDEVIVMYTQGPAVMRFVKVENCRDPGDMFFGIVKEINYLANLEKKPVTNELAESALIAIEGRTRESHPEQWKRGNAVELKDG